MSGDPIPPRDVSAYDPRKHLARCDLCPLANTDYVPFAPPEKKLKLVIVGEGPGRKEIQQRRPFVGVTGDILNDELRDAGIDRDEAHVTNAALCLGYTDKDNERAAECCAPRLLRELAALPKDVPILTLGKAATRSVLGVKSILLARGFIWTARDLTKSVEGAEAAVRKADRGKKDQPKIDTRLRLATLKERAKLAGRTVLPMLHPTFAFIHNEAWAPIFHVDLDRAARWLRGDLTYAMLEDNIKQVKSVSALKKGKRVFLVTDNVEDIDRVAGLLGTEIACDIETERLKPLSPLLARTLTVQLSDGVRGLVIGPWDPRRHAKALTRFLKGRTVVFHNGYNFDHLALERDGVSLEGAQIEDTLVAHHSFASQYPQKLDHVVATFLDSGPWKVRFGVRGAEEKGLAPTHVEEDELAEYGAVDAFVTIKAWRALQSDLESERAVYEHDKQLGVQGKLLQSVGIRVDRKRRRFLGKALKNRAASLKGRMRMISGRPNFYPSKLGDVRRVLFGVLRAPMLNPTATGLASTSNATLEVIRTGGAGTARRGPADTKQASGPIDNETRQTRAGRFAEALLRWRVATKIKSTYVDAVSIHADGRAHNNWRPYGTNCMPAGELVLTNRGYIPIERVIIGDEVISHTGKVRSVTHVAQRAPSPIYTVQLSNGLVLRTTGDHGYRVGDSWIRAKDLRMADQVTVHSDKEVWRQIRDLDYDVSSWGRIRRTGRSNTVDNLAWGTGMSRRGGSQSKLTVEKANRIRSESKGHLDDLRLAHEFGVSRELVRDVRLGSRWTEEDFITGKITKFKTAQVVSVSAGPPEVTYGLEVEVDHSHVTGGVVTHNSGRYSSRLQSCPRWSTAIEDRPREMYVASPGNVLVYFDLSQAEARMAANLSGDPNFIATCKGDVHTGNAKILFPQADALEMLTRDSKGKHCPQHSDAPVTGAACNCGKPYRDIAKNAGFAVAYLAEAPTVFAYLRAHGFPVELDDVETMLSALKNSYRRYYEYVAENVAYCEKHGHLRTAIMGRIRWFGYHPKPQEIANMPIQSGIADVMNIRSLDMQRELTKTAPRVQLVAQMHDACIWDTPREDSETVKALIVRTWDEPIRIKPGIVCREAREFLLPAEIKEGRRWSSFG